MDSTWCEGRHLRRSEPLALVGVGAERLVEDNLGSHLERARESIVSGESGHERLTRLSDEQSQVGHRTMLKIQRRWQFQVQIAERICYGLCISMSTFGHGSIPGTRSTIPGQDASA